MKNARTEWTAAKIARLAAGYAAGDRMDDIAADLGMSTFTVRHKARDLGLRHPHGPPPGPRDLDGPGLAGIVDRLRADLDLQGLYRFDDPRAARASGAA